MLQGWLNISEHFYRYYLVEAERHSYIFVNPSTFMSFQPVVPGVRMGSSVAASLIKEPKDERNATQR